MNNCKKLFTSLNVFVYKASRGSLGNRMGRQSVLVLNTIGRKSGKHYATTLSYYHDGNNYLVVASNWGKETHPDWYLNLMIQRRTSIQVGRDIIAIEARPAIESEYRRMWEQIVRKNNQYNKYQTGLKRIIPIVILIPTEAD